MMYGLVGYAVFAVSLLAAIPFLTGLGGAPGVDRGPAPPVPIALAIDLGLLALFAIQHTVMARPPFKRALVRAIPEAAERSTFVLAAALALLLLFWLWRPIPGSAWQLGGVPGAAVYGAGWVGWALLVAATFMISHLDLFGLRQAWLGAAGRPYTEPPFQTRWFYRLVRHPMMTAFLVIFWAAPSMTLGHLLFSGGATAYILVGTWFEERALLRSLPEYRDYRTRVPKLIPRPRRPAVLVTPPGGGPGSSRRAVP